MEKIAIYGEKDWQELAVRVGSWFICGEMKSFGDYSLAMEWLVD
ncbi:STAS/SEC14 domain-containing protein [Vibrio sp. UCD-FRSSP16_30]